MRVLLCCFISFIFSLSSYSKEFYFSYLSSEHGLSQITVTSIFQDSKGMMWFGTRNGLNRYDGYSFDIYQHESNNKSSLSDSHILCITQDSSENLWIGTNYGLNKLDPSTNKIERFFNKNKDEHSISNSIIHSLFTDKRGEVWIGTIQGLNKYNEETNAFERINHQFLADDAINTIIGLGDVLYIGTSNNGVILYDTKTKEIRRIKNSERFKNIKTLYLDRKNILWIGTQNDGVISYINKEGDYRIYTLKDGLNSDNIRCIYESHEGHILIGTYNGLNVLDPETQEIIHYDTQNLYNGSLSHSSIYSLFVDKAGTIWIGTYGGGINYYNQFGHKFQFYDLIQEQKRAFGIKGPAVEHKDKIYIATEGSGLVEMSKKANQGYQFELYKISEEGFPLNILKTVFVDGDKILCGTNLGTIYSFDTKTKQFALFYDFGSKNAIYQIGRNLAGELYVVGVNTIGFTLFTKDGKIKNTFHIENNDTFSFQNIRCVAEIEKEVYLLGSRSNGLYYFNRRNGELKNFRRFQNDTSKAVIPENYISSILKDSEGHIWIGTFGGGVALFDLDKGTFKTYDTTCGLLNNSVCAIVEENKHTLWISTISGISKLSIKSKEITNYDQSSGISINEFTPHAGLKLSNGKILFSGNNGLITFDPKRMYVNPNKPPIILKNIYINNNKVIPGSNDNILEKQLMYQKEITLNHKQTNIAIEYSGLNFILPERNQYAYKLEGFDKEWTQAGNRQIAYYTNIPPGTYKFTVMASNNDDVWNQEGTSIQLKILPPFWKTGWAYGLYTLITITLLYIIFRYYNERKLLENKIKIEQTKVEVQKEFHEARNRLFTNFSHELRTPLTLIMSPLRNMIENNDGLPIKIKEYHKLMYNNTLRLLRLVNNLMDFQKKESGTLTLNLQQYDFIIFANEMVELFNELAYSRKITLKFEHSINTLHCVFDLDLMEKVFFNFLSNAFKNVPDKGNVIVSLNVADLTEIKKQQPTNTDSFTKDSVSYLILKFKDSGQGIPENQLEDIFLPFYQVAQNKHSASGTGLGLSLSKSIIELHQGKVWAENQVNGGAIFTCILPIETEKPENSSKTNPLEHKNSFLHKTIELPRKSTTLPVYSPDKKHLVLIVEDNPDVQEYIATCLSEYNIILASNGEEGVKKAIEKQPDLIISDLMMPKMDGMEMVSILKNNIRTSHIPVIMLTARSTSSDMQEGYNIGADDYITKPFDSSVLIVRVKNIIQNREKLKVIYGKDFSLDTLGIEVSPLEKQFMQKLYKVMELNLSNPQFNLDFLSQEIGMSKATLYRKLKSITDLTPNEFIRNYRLEVGAKMLRETELPISEIYVAIGFNSIAYFSTCFKNRYNMTPTEYIADVKKGNPPKQS